MKKVSFVLVALLCGYHGLAQLSRAALPTDKGIYAIKGDYYFDHKNYVIAINYYSKSNKQNSKDAYVMARMAESYHKLGKDDLALNWYAKTLVADPDIDEIYILKYILLLNEYNKPGDVKYWITVYNDKIAKAIADGNHDLYKDSILFVVYNLTSVNSSKSDSGPFLYNNKLIFSSNRASGGYYSYASAINSKGQVDEASPFHAAINSGPKPGTLSIATKPATLFFTGVSHPVVDSAALMEIFYCNIPSNPSDELKIKALTFKNFDHSMGHPTVNSNGTLMFFAAHSPKHTHGFDLYKSELIGKKWSFPVALSSAINSHGDELYPTLYHDSILYFASNGHHGLGGFDIYKMNLRHRDPHLEHLNAPLNSTSNDFGISLDSTGHTGYLSSNRAGGLGGDDLYGFYMLPVKKTKVDGSTAKPEELLLYTSKGDEIKLLGSTKGNLKFDFAPGRKYNLVVEYNNFKSETSKTNSPIALPKLNVYTFDIQKSVEAVYDQKNKSAPIQDIHINPGDLVTFQLIPNLTTDYDSDAGKILFDKTETVINDRESIIFSYVAEGGSKMPDVEDTTPLASLDALDTVSSTQPQLLLAKSTPVKVDKKTSAKINSTATEESPVDNKAEKLVSPLPQNTTPVAVINTASADSLRMQNGVAKNEVKDHLPFQPVEATTLPNQLMSGNDKNIVAQENAVKPVQQQNAVAETDKITSRGSQLSDSLKQEKIVVANNPEEKASIPSPSVSAVTLPNEVLDKIIDSVAVANKDDVQQNKSSETIPVSDSNPSDSLAAKNAVSGNSEVKEKAAEVVALQNQSDTKNTDQITASNIEAVQDNRSEEIKSVSSNPSSDSLALKNIVASSDETKEEPPSDANAGQNKPTDKNNIPDVAAENAVTKTQQNAPVKNEINDSSSPKETNQPEPVVTEVHKPSDSLDHVIAKRNVIDDVSPSSLENPESNILQYRVQIAASRSKLSDTYLNKIYKGSNEIRVFKEDGYFKYYIEQTPNYSSAKVTLKECGVGDAFIAAYKGDTKWRLHDAIAFQKNGQTLQMPLADETSNVDPVIADMSHNVAEERVEPDTLKDISLASTATTQDDKINSDAVTPNSTSGVEGNTVQSENPKSVSANTTVGSEQLIKSAGPVDSVSENIPIIKDEPTSSLQPDSSAKAQENIEHNVVGNNAFRYRVQIAASKSEMTLTSLKKIYTGANEIRSFNEDGFHKYYIQETPNYFIAKHTLQESNVQHAFISAYQGDTKWILQEAIANQYKQPVVQSELAKTDSVIKIVTVNFQLDEFTLAPDQVSHLHESVIRELKNNPAYHSIVNGYTDIRGTEEYNFGLSQERAFFVENLILKDDINSNRVTTQYFGESQVLKYCPKHERCDESVHQANRRVEILLLTNKNK